jgi:hypothetical protein
MAGIILGFYYHQVAIKVIFRSDPTVEGARGASRNVPLAAEVPPQKVNRVCVAWTDRPRVAVTARKIKTFRMGCARVKWIAGNPSMNASSPIELAGEIVAAFVSNRSRLGFAGNTGLG